MEIGRRDELPNHGICRARTLKSYGSGKRSVRKGAASYES
jgi:hypothetical protein